MQFAPWVAFHPDTFAYLEHYRAMLAGFIVAFEFRYATWFSTEKHTARTLAFERDNELVNVIVDAPTGIPSTIPSVWEVTHPRQASCGCTGATMPPGTAKVLPHRRSASTTTTTTMSSRRSPATSRRWRAGRHYARSVQQQLPGPEPNEARER